MASSMQGSTPDFINATIRYYLSPADGGPSDHYVVRTAGSRRRECAPHRVRIHDLRGHEDEFNLDQNGFQLVRLSTKETDFNDGHSIKAHYHPEIEQLMKENTGASHVYIYSHTIREFSYAQELETLKTKKDDEVVDLETPTMFAHVDQSYRGASLIVDSVAAGASSLSYIADLRDNSSRWAIVNAWRPLKPVTREPLAVCDARTVHDSDLRAITARVRPAEWDDVFDRKRYAVRDHEFWQVAANPSHRWYWQREQTPEEVLLIKCFDSRMDVARRCPHSAIQTPDDHGGPRESIEVRCFLFWEGTEKEGEMKGRL